MTCPGGNTEACPWELLFGVKPTDENIAKAQVLVQDYHQGSYCEHASAILTGWFDAIQDWHKRRPAYPTLAAGKTIDLPAEVRKQWESAIEAVVEETSEVFCQHCYLELKPGTPTRECSCCHANVCTFEAGGCQTCPDLVGHY